MSNLLKALLAVGMLAVSGAANAQSGCQYIVTNAVLTAAQWNWCFQQKQDALGYTAVNKAGDAMAGRLSTIAATTSKAGFAVLPGAVPISPSNGDIWVTSAGMFVQVNGATVGPLVGAVNPTFSGNFSGNITFLGQTLYQATSAPTSASGNTVVLGTLAAPPTLTNNGQAFLYNMTANGNVIQGAGSTYDAAIVNKSGSIVAAVPTGTTTLKLPSLGTGACSASLALDGSNQLITSTWCPGTATTIAVGSTAVSSGKPGYALTNSGGTLANGSLFSDRGGFLNKFRNPGFTVWMRGTTATAISVSGSYFADGWQVGFSGSSSVTASRGGQATSGKSPYSLNVVGATGNTDINVFQRIESYDASQIAGQTVTVQFKYFQNTGSSQTPKVSGCFASVTDNFGTCTADLAATTLTACATGTWCQEAYTFNVSASASQGYQITFDCNASFNSGSLQCSVADAEVRVTPGVTTGINSSPPSIELRPQSTEILINQRYFYSSYSSFQAPGTSIGSGCTGLCTQQGAAYAFLSMNISYPVPLRVTPTTTTVYDDAGASGKVSYYNGAWNNGGASLINGTTNAYINIGANNITGCAGLSFMFTASAEL